MRSTTLLHNIRRRYVPFGTRRPWLLPALLALLGLFIALVGSLMAVNTKTGVIFIAVVFAVLFGLWIAVQPTIGIYLLAAFVFLNLSDILEVQFGIPSINKAVVGLVFVSILANRLVFLRKPFIFRRSELLILIYFLITLFSVFFAEDRAQALTSAIDNLKDFVIILIVVQMCDSERPWRTVQRVILVSATLVASLSCYQVLTHNFTNTFFGLASAPSFEITTGFDSTRVTGPLSDPNYYGQILLVALPFGIYAILTEQRRLYRLLAIACTLPILLTIVFTYSRGAFITLIVIGILIVRERNLNPFKVLAGVVVLLAVAIPLLPVGYLDRLLTLADIFPQDVTLQTEASFRGRSSEMIIAVRMFIDNPIVGVGYKNYEINYPTYNALLGLDPRFGEREPHDLFLEILAETGIIGFIAFVAAMTAIFTGIRRAKRQLIAIEREDLISGIAAIESSIVAFLVTSIFLHGAYIRYLWLLVALAAGSMVLVETLVRQRREALNHREEGIYVLQEMITT